VARRASRTARTGAVERLAALLPQIQCRACGERDCQAFAEALAAGHADPERCLPGGTETARRLGALLARIAHRPPAAPREPSTDAGPPQRSDAGEVEPGARSPATAKEGHATAAAQVVLGAVAVVAEEECIGCARCLPACPVDAIVGAPRRMHTVIEAECTGCGLCLAACPVDCLRLLAPPAPVDPERWRRERAPRARARYRAHRERREAARRGGRAAGQAPERARLRAEVAAALERVRRRRAARGWAGP